MSEKILVPVLGESITEATVAKWLKNAGDTVEADEPIVELETDKVNLEVPSPINGVLSEINSKDGSIVEVGALLGSVSENGSVSLDKKEEINKTEPEPKITNFPDPSNNFNNTNPLKKNINEGRTVEQLLGRIPHVKSQLPKNNQNILEIGCGFGRLPIGLLQVFDSINYLGIDVHKASIDWCKKFLRNDKSKMKFLHLNLKF